MYWVGSSGRRNVLAEGGCDGRSTAFGSVSSREAAVAGSSRGRSARDAAGVLGVHRPRSLERGRSDEGRDLATGRLAVVPDGRRDGATHLSPSSKRPSARYLSLAEREEIALLRAQGHGVCAVARRLGRACPQGVLAHDPLDAVQPARDALGQHVMPDPPCAIGAAASSLSCIRSATCGSERFL